MIRRLSKINSTRSYLSSLVFRRDSHSQVRTIRENERNTEPKEKKDQHLLTNTRVLDAIFRSCDVKPTDTVLEIGPGTGNLTMKLLEAAHNVVAVEKDKCMVEILRKRVSENGFEDKLTVIQKDVLNTNFPHFDLVVANTPYDISSPFLEKLFYRSNTFRSATLLLEKEFSRRLLANPGDSYYNRLAANVKLVADVKFVMDVSKREFVPPHEVDSSLVMIIPKEVKPDVDVQEWLAFTCTCFANKNKTLGSIFSENDKAIWLRYMATQWPDFEDEEEEEEEGAVTFPFYKKLIWIVSSSGFEDKRPSDLSHVELLQLLNRFHKFGVFFSSLDCYE